MAQLANERLDQIEAETESTQQDDHGGQ